MQSLLSHTARSAVSSAIRDLLEHAQRPGMISLAGGLPDPNRFPHAELAAAASRLLHEHGPSVLQYGLTAGELDLRRHIVATTPSAESPDEVLVTTGSQQALHLLAQVLLDPGDAVVVGDPDYLGALQAFRSRDAHLVPVTVDADGLDVDVLEAALAAGLRPKIAYVVPRFHNPTGASLHEERRARLLELAEHHGFLVLFDDPYRELTADDAAPEPAPHPAAVQLRSVSKVLAPGLRVGWIIGPSWLLDAVERAKQSADLHTSTLTQALVLDAVTADWFPDHLARLRTTTRDKRDALAEALREAFGERLEFALPAGGMFVWAAFTDGTDASTLLPAALDHGVAFVPGAAFAVERPLKRRLRLSWATSTPAELRAGVERLDAACASIRPTARRRPLPHTYETLPAP